MKKFLFKLLCISFCLLSYENTYANQPTHYISLLQAMFTQVTVEKNAEAIPLFYAKDFQLHTNGRTTNYDDFLHQHQTLFKTSIQYKIRYDEPTLIEEGNKVAGRAFITVTNPNESPHEIEVILIAKFKGDLLQELWELTYPDWSKLPAFKKIS